uniref:Uncharacterized protein n=1 Tax=Romanomermis culicivorax TaxID=13658 RepID=A0A915IGL3_ROMCU
MDRQLELSKNRESKKPLSCRHRMHPPSQFRSESRRLPFLVVVIVLSSGTPVVVSSSSDARNSFITIGAVIVVEESIRFKTSDESSASTETRQTANANN